MSTATAFKYYQPFVGCPAGVPFAGGDYVDATFADAMRLFWLLESISITTTGTRLGASINFTNTLGPTESLGFTPSSFTRQGAYYDTTTNPATPARQPMGRVCTSSGRGIYAIFASAGTARATAGNPAYFASMQIAVGKSGNLSLPIRVYYGFQIASGDLTTPAFLDQVIVGNPSVLSGIVGTIPSSGTFSFGPLTFNWVGGGYRQVIATLVRTWQSETASISVSTGFFTF